MIMYYVILLGIISVVFFNVALGTTASQTWSQNCVEKKAAEIAPSERE